MLVVAVISVDAYPFFGFLRPELFAHGSAALQLFLVLWIFLRSLGVVVTTDEI